MAEANFTAYQGRISIDISEFSEPCCSAYCVVMTGVDGMVISGTRLSDDFDQPSAAFTALASLKGKYPNAAVFGSAGLAA